MSDAQPPVLTPEVVSRLSEVAAAAGVLRLSGTTLDASIIARAQQTLGDFLDAGHHGEMEFLRRTEAMRGDPGLLLPGAASALVGVVPYGGRSGPIARYAQWADYHTIVHRRLERIVESLESLVPGVRTKICVDTKPIPERTLAMMAGVGFQGKHGCLIVPGLGSYVVIGTILTDAVWTEAATSPEHHDASSLTSSGAPWDACGSCRACLDACPTQAFEGPARLDARKCISYLTIEHRGPIDEALATQMGVRIAGCDVCQEVCPHNMSPSLATRSLEAQRLPPVEGVRDRDLSLATLANVGNNQHKGFVRGSALNRIPRRSMRRNALIALGNRAKGLTPEEASSVRETAAGEDPELRAWAGWVLARHADGGVDGDDLPPT